MRYAVPAALAVLSFALVSCTDTTNPAIQEQIDESLATTVAGAGVDPNAETYGGHTAAPPAVTCSWDATTKWTTCSSTHNGLTVTRQMQFLNGAGVAQQKPDTSTRSMKSKTTVTGTTPIKSPVPGGPTGTTTVSRQSEETVTGLAPTSKQRVVNGTASGNEDSQATDAKGTHTVKRQYADTTKDLTLTSPPNPLAPWPVAGTVTRNIKATVTPSGGAAKDYISREVHTFEAGGKVTIKITTNGQTRTCVIQMGTTPKSPPVCTQG